MISISPIYEGDSDRPYREFFEREFISQRLGKSGRWQGDGATLLRLGNPVQLETFQRLLNGQTPDGAKRLVTESSNHDRELGWRLTISASQSLTVLWALAPRLVRARIEQTHASCVKFALWNFERAVSGWDWQGSGSRNDYPAGVFAKFRCGAAWDQTPHLHTTVFFFNLGLHNDGTVRTFTTEQVFRQRFQLQGTYELKRDVMLCNEIGAYRQVRGADLRIVGVPQELCRRFFFDASFRPQIENALTQRPEPLRSDQLFGKWQQQAAEWGWGPKQAEMFLRDAQKEQARQDRAADFESQMIRVFKRFHRARDSLKKLIQGTAKQSKEPASRQNKDDGNTHSH